ncbi:MAG TPA: energy-coupling factor transporter ATPase [Candidatus Eubacterium avistercoris]|uniref:Energy-coupling factor transporter ATP-binding protein EcfA2 n=1 Tax=Candidatus Eubacterium avistercoris TaxID=2838567 RepID=A0A9D2D5A2_9FIRM|nr:energy-coupling factor transporter ATPase [Candidatus Eubacterium avistercoris]
MSMEMQHVSYVYETGTSYEQTALHDINLKIEDGQLIGIIGHTGSGKSTLIQLMNGLIRASSGQVLFHGKNIYDPDFKMKELRGKVGLVFQYPEYQLFETTVLRDAAFGPKNQGLSEEEAVKKAQDALMTVGLTEQYWQMSPFELSGGQKRRAAIAGVLAMEPEVLILDEPTAGLDPRGRDELFAQIQKMHREKHMTVMLVSHSMEDVADYAQRIIVLDQGRILYDGTPREVFAHYKELEQAGLAAPQVTYLMHELQARGLPVNTDIITVEEAKKEILKLC